MIYIKQTELTQDIYIPRDEQLEDITSPCECDCDEQYDEGYLDGYTEGVADQKVADEDRLTTAEFTSNGEYNADYGYRKVIVNVETGGTESAVLDTLDVTYEDGEYGTKEYDTTDDSTYLNWYFTYGKSYNNTLFLYFSDEDILTSDDDIITLTGRFIQHNIGYLLHNRNFVLKLDGDGLYFNDTLVAPDVDLSEGKHTITLTYHQLIVDGVEYNSDIIEGMWVDGGYVYIGNTAGTYGIIKDATLYGVDITTSTGSTRQYRAKYNVSRKWGGIYDYLFVDVVNKDTYIYKDAITPDEETYTSDTWSHTWGVHKIDGYNRVSVTVPNPLPVWSDYFTEETCSYAGIRVYLPTERLVSETNDYWTNYVHTNVGCPFMPLYTYEGNVVPVQEYDRVVKKARSECTTEEWTTGTKWSVNVAGWNGTCWSNTQALMSSTKYSILPPVYYNVSTQLQSYRYGGMYDTAVKYGITRCTTTAASDNWWYCTYLYPSSSYIPSLSWMKYIYLPTYSLSYLLTSYTNIYWSNISRYASSYYILWLDFANDTAMDYDLHSFTHLDTWIWFVFADTLPETTEGYTITLPTSAQDYMGWVWIERTLTNKGYNYQYA